MNICKIYEVKIEGKVMLGATLTVPQLNNERTKFPAVLIIPGTGNLNRDGNAKWGRMRLNLYRQLAEYITSLGFVTLRYDKRGVGTSKGKVHQTSMWDLVDDAETALEFLRRHPKVDPEKVFVLGHSEGTILATALNARNPVSGLILLAGAGSKLDEAIKSQQELAFAELEQLKGLKGFLIKKLKVVEKSKKKNKAFFNKVLNSNKDVMRMGIVRVNTKWFKQHHMYDLFADYEKITCPVLAMTGKMDIQADYKGLKKLTDYIDSPLETYVVVEMNHGLKEQRDHVSILDAKSQYKRDVVKDLHREFKKLLKQWLTEQVS